MKSDNWLQWIWIRVMSIKSAALKFSQKSTLAEQFADVIGSANDLPEDMAAQHDHYVRGTPKRMA